MHFAPAVNRVRLLVVLAFIVGVSHISHFSGVKVVDQVHAKKVNWVVDFIAQNNLDKKDSEMAETDSSVPEDFTGYGGYQHLNSIANLTMNKASVVETSHSKMAANSKTENSVSPTGSEEGEDVSAYYKPNDFSGLGAITSSEGLVLLGVDSAEEYTYTCAPIHQESYSLDDKNNSNRFTYSILAGPTLLTGNLSQAIIKTYQGLTDLNNITTSALNTSSSRMERSFSVMGVVGMQLGEHLQLNAGVNYTQASGYQQLYLKNKVTYTHTVLVFPGVALGETAEAELKTIESNTYFVDTLTTQLTRKTLEIPVYMSYVMGNGKFKYYLEGGLNTVLASFVSGTYQSNYLEIKDVTNQQIGVQNVNVLCGLGLSYELNKKTSIKFIPSYQHSIFNHQGLSSYENLTLFTGINIRF